MTQEGGKSERHFVWHQTPLETVTIILTLSCRVHHRPFKMLQHQKTENLLLLIPLWRNEFDCMSKAYFNL